MQLNREAHATGAENVRWNLSDLYPSEGELKDQMEAERSRAEAFAKRYRERLGSLSFPELSEAIARFEEIHDGLDRAYTYAFLNWCTRTNDSTTGALLQWAREQYTSVSQTLIFFELELIHLPEDTAVQALEHPALERYRHFLETLRLRKDHVLSEAEEKILSEKEITGHAAWSRFFDETLSAARFPFRGEEISEQAILSKLYMPDRQERKDAATGFTEGLKANLRTLTYIFNTVLAEKASDDRLRNYSDWLASRNLANEISDEAVTALVDAVTSRYDLVARFYRLKRKLLGLDQLFDYDRYAPIASVDKRYSWEEAQNLVLTAYSEFHSTLGTIAEQFFTNRWIDAVASPGKRSGAFSHRAVPQVHPYILMNFTGNFRDVQTLAHEMGHGVHQYLSREKGSLQGGTPLTTAETASVFGEMLVFDRIVQSEDDDRARLAMLVSKIDDSLATVFRQITMNRFEDRIHNARRLEGELPAEKYSRLWIDTQREMFQDSVTLGDHYSIWWSYIPHFIHTPGYVYAYAFGELLVLALYAIYRANAEDFPERYCELLKAGGSDWPHVLVGKLGVDLQDPEFWNQGLSEIETLITEAEKLSQTA